jgi:hypothetical protein
VSFDNSGDDTSPTFGARYHFNDKFAVLADVTLLDGSGTSWFLGGRLNLGR